MEKLIAWIAFKKSQGDAAISDLERMTQVMMRATLW